MRVSCLFYWFWSSIKTQRSFYSPPRLRLPPPPVRSTTMAVPRSTLFLFCLLAAGCRSLEVTMDAHAGTYEVKHLGKSMFRGEDGVAIFTNGNWVSVGSGLSAASSRTVTGTDAGLGDFSALEVSWTDGTHEHVVAASRDECQVVQGWASDRVRVHVAARGGGDQPRAARQRHAGRSHRQLSRVHPHRRVSRRTGGSGGDGL